MINPVGPERRGLGTPGLSGKPVDRVDSSAVVNGSPNIGVGNPTARIVSAMHGHQIDASLAGHNASIPTKEHRLGINIDRRA